MGGSLASRALVGLGAAVLCLQRPAAEPASSSAKPVNGSTSSPSLTSGSQQPALQCWHGGYTPDICCRTDPVLNCWDAQFTFARCCPPLPPAAPPLPPLPPLPPAPPAAAAAAPAEAAGLSVTAVVGEPSQPSHFATAGPQPPAAVEPQRIAATAGAAAGGELTGSAGGDASCWGGGFTYDRCCKVAPIVAAVDGCWDPVFTEARCCRRGASAGLEATVPPAAADADVGSPRPAPVVSEVVRPTLASLVVQGADLEGTPPAAEADQEDDGQSQFLRREGARRWPRYFHKAHQLLDMVLASSLEPSPGPAAVDEVQIYHNIYEVVNQVVGGIQLASEAQRGLHSHTADTAGAAATHEGEAQIGTSNNQAADGGSAALRAAFLNAAIVLARLAQVSQGTAFEPEDFGAQAGAAVALSCRQRDDGLFSEDLARRLQWLQRGQAEAEGRHGRAWRSALLETLRKRMNSSDSSSSMAAMFERSWHMYADDLAEAVWRPAAGHASEGELPHTDRSTLNPLDDRLAQAPRGAGSMWQIFSTYVMAKPLQQLFSRGSGAGGAGCPACLELSRIVLEKYAHFQLLLQNDTTLSSGVQGSARAEERGRREMGPAEVNNAFFAWQLTHESEQEDERGQQQWPELYRDSEDFVELKNIAKLACLEYLQQVYDAPLSALDLAQLELSIWASVTPAGSKEAAGSMGLAFHDHPLALLSGVFYAQAGGRRVAERTPTVFADPRGTPAFRYTRRRQAPGAGDAQAHSHGPGRPRPADAAPGKQTPEATMEPTAPFHRMAYAHAYEGQALVFPSWLVHGVPPHGGSDTRVTFAFNLHTLHGTTLSSWAKTTL